MPFAVSTKTVLNDGSDKWESVPTSWEEAVQILISNGWKKEEAITDLLLCPDNWIPVNSYTQIC